MEQIHVVRYGLRCKATIHLQQLPAVPTLSHTIHLQQLPVVPTLSHTISGSVESKPAIDQANEEHKPLQATSMLS